MALILAGHAHASFHVSQSSCTRMHMLCTVAFPTCSVLRSHGSGWQLQVAEGTWRPLVVEVGALGSVTGVSKIAASVIAPLADRKVSVYCVSTNQEDYVLVSLHRIIYLGEKMTI